MKIPLSPIRFHKTKQKPLNPAPQKPHAQLPNFYRNAQNTNPLSSHENARKQIFAVPCKSQILKLRCRSKQMP